MNGFHWRRAMAVFWKDALDLRKNRGLLWSMATLPAVLTFIPVFIVWSYANKPDDPNLKAMAYFYDVTVPAERAVAFLIEKVLIDWFSLYLMMPVFIPVLIASHSVAGEKEKRTLEPLLASPVTGLELLVGKSLASLIPALFLSFTSFAVFCVAVDIVAWPVFQGPVLPNTTWWVGVFLIAPIFAFFGNGVAVLVSMRVGDARLAQQISGLFVLPLVGLAGGQFAGYLSAGPQYYAVIGAIVLVFDAALLWVSVRLFDRERLISRWG